MDPRRFGFTDFILLAVVVALAGGTRALYLVECCDGGKSAGPLRVEDMRLSVEDLGDASGPAEVSAAFGAAPARRGAFRRPRDLEGLQPLAGAGELTDLDEMVYSMKDEASKWLMYRTPLAQRAEQSAYSAPGYPFVVGYLGRYLSDEKLVLTVRWAQCVLGALTAGFYFLFARRAFHSLVVAGLAGVLCAVHPFWVIDTAAIDDGVLSTFLLAATLFFGMRGVQASGAFSSLLFGLGLAALALVRAMMLPFAAVSFLWFLLRCQTVPRGWLCALLAFLGFANGLLPSFVWNWQRFHDVIPIVESGSVQAWEGNHAGATGGRATAAEWKDVRTEAQQVQSRQHRYIAISDRVEKEIVRDPLATVNRRLSAGLYFFFGQRWFSEDNDSSDKLAIRLPEPETMPHWLEMAYPGALSGSLLVMLLLGVLGWRWTYGWRLSAMPSSLALMWIPLPYILTHADALSGPRLPLDGVLLCYAAFALACFVPKLSARLRAGHQPVVVREVGRR